MTVTSSLLLSVSPLVPHPFFQLHSPHVPPAAFFHDPASATDFVPILRVTPLLAPSPSAPTSLCFCPRVGQAVAGRAEGGGTWEADGWQTALPTAPQKECGGMGKGRHGANAAAMPQSRRKGKGTQGLGYALFLLILGLPSAAIRPSSATVSVGPGR